MSDSPAYNLSAGRGTWPDLLVLALWEAQRGDRHGGFALSCVSDELVQFLGIGRKKFVVTFLVAEPAEPRAPHNGPTFCAVPAVAVINLQLQDGGRTDRSNEQ